MYPLLFYIRVINKFVYLHITLKNQSQVYYVSCYDVTLTESLFGSATIDLMFSNTFRKYLWKMTKTSKLQNVLK